MTVLDRILARRHKSKPLVKSSQRAASPIAEQLGITNG